MSMVEQFHEEDWDPAEEGGDKADADQASQESNSNVAFSGDSEFPRENPENADLIKKMEQTPREAGRERIEKAGQWISGFLKGTGEKVKSGWNFLKKLGQGARDGVVVGANTLGAGLEAATEHVMGAPEYYKHVKAETKDRAAEVGGRIQESYGKMMEAKDRAVEGGKQKIGQIFEAGRQKRDGLAERFKGWQAKRESDRIMKEHAAQVAKLDREIAQREASTERSQLLLERAMQMLEANNRAAEQLRAQRQQLVESRKSQA